MIRVLEVDTELDLRPLLAALAQQGIRFRVNEESGSQVIRVVTELEAAQTMALFQQWRQLNEPGVYATAAPAGGAVLAGYFPVAQYVRSLATALAIAPVTMLIIALALLVAFVSRLGSDPDPVMQLFYPQFQLPYTGLVANIAALCSQINGIADFLRMLTPALLHFGAVHLVFDTLWLWYFGRMIETSQSSLLYLVLVVWLALVSNTSQYLWSLSSGFGGLSGVVYGLLGYLWMWQTVLPGGRLRLQPSMIGFMLVALVLMEVFASAWIATAAHAGGLVAGMTVGVGAALVHRFRHS